MLSDRKSVFWYVLFAANGKAGKISNYLKTNNIECFFPLGYKENRIRNSERTRRILEPLLRNYVFVKSSKASLEPHLQEIKRRFSITSGLYYRDLGSGEIVMVPEKQMQDFITVSRLCEERIIYLSNEEVKLEKGRKIRITGGVFEGVEGVFMRAKGDRRVIVSLPNLFSVATAFVPLEFIEPLDNEIEK
jgi:transcription antitermination factor NusG